VKVMGIELDYIFRGKKSKNFLKLIAHHKNLNLYKMKVVKNLVNFLWMYFTLPMFVIMFIPFVIYFCFFITYASYSMGFKNEENSHLPIIRWITLGFLLYNILFLTGGRIYTLRLKSLTSIWIWFDVISAALNFFVIAIDLLNWDINKINAACSMAVLLMWFKFFYFLRMFRKTTTLVRLII